jgi:hypothetical protein
MTKSSRIADYIELEITGLCPPSPTPVLESAQGFLEEAVYQMKDRAEQRDCKDTGERSMDLTVKLFNLYTGKNITEEEGWMFMVFLKQVRAKQGSYRRDDFVDLCAYEALRAECVSKKGTSK